MIDLEAVAAFLMFMLKAVERVQGMTYFAKFSIFVSNLDDTGSHIFSCLSHHLAWRNTPPDLVIVSYGLASIQLQYSLISTQTLCL